MARASINIQDGFLFQHLKSGESIAVQLTTGERLQGQLKRYDQFTIVLQLEDREVLVYKHGIVSIAAFSPTSSPPAGEKARV